MDDEHEVVDYIVHEGFNYRKTVWESDYSDRPSLKTVLQDDIVLLELEDHVILEIRTPACLPRNQSGALDIKF